MPAQPPVSPDQIVNLISHAAVFLAAFVFGHPYVAIFILGAIAVIAELPQIVGVLVVLVVVSYLISYASNIHP